MIEIDKLVAKNKKLGSLPEVVHRVFAAMDDPNSTATQIGKVINEDPALTGRLLKLVNSPFYGFRSKIDTVFRAIALIGHNELRSVVLATSALKVFSGIPSDLVNMSLFWKRSLYMAVVARVLAAFKREKEIERFFIAGLLHDLGSLLLYLELPDEMTNAMTRNKNERIPLWEAEKDELGYDHAEVGGALLKSWNLPPVLCEAVRYHLYPERASSEYRDAANLLHLAWQIVRHHIERDPLLTDDAEISESLWLDNKMQPDVLDQILEKARQQYEASQDILLS
ncbi:MAG: HDOD domain-containing protein [Gammaproteobacteria bacterium]|nr:HDOD domain-containing protein [Gammaproteobacteria bacterium]MDH5734642.1 HDOD domain-containing protein [Gammaproteobacteria bacterium]